MVYPVTGCMFSSYKKLMHNLVMAKVWQTAFEKDFRGMAQSCNKTGQKGTNAMFVMMHPLKKKKFYRRIILLLSNKYYI
jgi:hypothetical protein